MKYFFWTFLFLSYPQTRNVVIYSLITMCSSVSHVKCDHVFAVCYGCSESSKMHMHQINFIDKMPKMRSNDTETRRITLTRKSQIFLNGTSFFHPFSEWISGECAPNHSIFFVVVVVEFSQQNTVIHIWWGDELESAHVCELCILHLRPSHLLTMKHRKTTFEPHNKIITKWIFTQRRR